MLHGWDNFFVTTAQAGAALIGLLFVTVTVGTGFSTPHMLKGTRAFLTPTLVHFAGVLFLSVAMLAPWPSLWPIAVITGLFGLFGLVYQVMVVRDRRDTKLVKMGWSEWMAYAYVPGTGSASLIAAALALVAEKSFAPYLIAAGTVALLFSGIYGAWDITLWLVRNRGSH